MLRPEMVSISGGEFRMGNDAGPENERPGHRVCLPPFRAAVSPVTNAEYELFVRATGTAPPPFALDERFGAPDQPVVGVSWKDAVAYCRWLSRELGSTYRLPSEAEREYAALGGLSGVDWPWGDGHGEHPLAATLASLDRLHTPAEECANGYRLRCMADNVHEWCDDWYDVGYYARSPAEAPRGPANGSRKVARGGSWRHQIKFTRVTARASLNPLSRYNDFGFRVYSDA